MNTPLQEATRLGIPVDITPLPDGILGYYLHADRRIELTTRLTPIEERCVLAHELGHAHFGHTYDSDRAERQADADAVRLLIDPADFAAAERLNPEPRAMADELDVTVESVELYRKLLRLAPPVPAGAGSPCSRDCNDGANRTRSRVSGQLRFYENGGGGISPPPPPPAGGLPPPPPPEVIGYPARPSQLRYGSQPTESTMTPSSNTWPTPGTTRPMGRNESGSRASGGNAASNP